MVHVLNVLRNYVFMDILIPLRLEVVLFELTTVFALHISIYCTSVGTPCLMQPGELLFLLVFLIDAVDALLYYLLYFFKN